MVCIMPTMTGGDKLMAALKAIDQRLASAGSQPNVRVGFLEGTEYPDGTSLPMVAAMNEFGGTIQRAAGTVTVYRKASAKGTHFLRQGRFVKLSQSNFSSTHAVGAYSITIPPRPFFRNMIAKYGPTWAGEMGKMLKDNDYDARKVLTLMGELIVGQLRQSIQDTNTPPNAPSTIARKGFNDPLIDTSHMYNSADFEVST